MFQNSVFLQAATYTGLAALLVIVSVWWLYLSPLKKIEELNQSTEATKTSPRLAAWIAFLLGIAALCWVGGALWDASMHIRTGEIPAGADFLWPPHLMLYSGFLLAFLVALITIGVVAANGWKKGLRDPRRWIRNNPYLGAVALASLYELVAIPGDALWHEIFGRDLTAWSPPHVLIALSASVVILCAIGVLFQSRPVGLRFDWRDIAIVVLLGLMLNVIYIVGVLEWELPNISPIVSTRPIWFYPLVGGGLAFFTLVLARRMVNFRGAATASALAFYLVRLAITLALGLTDNITPSIPLLFILGAVLMDFVPWKKITSWALRGLALAAAFTAGYALLALPQLALRTNLKFFHGDNYLMMIAAMLAASLLLLPLARGLGTVLRGRKTV